MFNGVEGGVPIRHNLFRIGIACSCHNLLGSNIARNYTLDHRLWRENIYFSRTRPKWMIYGHTLIYLSHDHSFYIIANMVLL